MTGRLKSIFRVQDAGKEATTRDGIGAAFVAHDAFADGTRLSFLEFVGKIGIREEGTAIGDHVADALFHQGFPDHRAHDATNEGNRNRNGFLHRLAFF